MSAYPVEHVPTRERVLTRFAEMIRIRKEVVLNVLETGHMVTERERLEGMVSAYETVLALIETEHQKVLKAEVTELLNEAGDKHGF